MKARTLVTILLKLMAFYVFFDFLLMLPTLLQGVTVSLAASQHGKELPFFAYFFALSLIYLAFALGLFFAAPRLSRLFAGDEDEEVIVAGSIPDDAPAWAFRCFGVYALVTWGPKLLQTLCKTLLYGTWKQDQVSFLQRFFEDWSFLISPLAGVALGLLLLFKAHGLVRLVQRSRPTSSQHVELENTENDRQPSAPSNPHSPSAQGDGGR